MPVYQLKDIINTVTKRHAKSCLSLHDTRKPDYWWRTCAMLPQVLHSWS